MINALTESNYKLLYEIKTPKKGRVPKVEHDETKKKREFLLHFLIKLIFIALL